MSASLYTYITSPYLRVIFPNSHLEDPDWNHFQTLSTLLALDPNRVHSPIGTEVIKFIHINHQFEARLYPDTPIDLIVTIDINPVNSSPTPFYNFACSVKTNVPTYYLHWDILPCTIPAYLHISITQHCMINSIPPELVLKAFENWFAHLLLAQNNLTLHLREP